MASSPLFSFRPAGIQVCSASGTGRNGSGPNRAAKWWAPIFGWAPETEDCFGDAAAAAGTAAAAAGTAAAAAGTGGSEPVRPASGRKFAALTEEKARQLRMKTHETYSFHDAMYHSAIASRLASDFNNRSE